MHLHNHVHQQTFLKPSQSFQYASPIPPSRKEKYCIKDFSLFLPVGVCQNSKLSQIFLTYSSQWFHLSQNFILLSQIISDMLSERTDLSQNLTSQKSDLYPVFGLLSQGFDFVAQTIDFLSQSFDYSNFLTYYLKILKSWLVFSKLDLSQKFGLLRQNFYIEMLTP